MTEATSSPKQEQPLAERPVDGRRARRERGRVAVSDAMVDLVFEGFTPPSAEQVAARAGVSVASLYRYFETLDDLRHHTVARYFERYDYLFAIPSIGEGPLSARIDGFVSARLLLHETTAPMSRLVRTRGDQQLPRDTIERVRATTADQIRNHFDHELGSLTAAARDDLVAVINVLTSFESWDQMRHSSGRSKMQTARSWNSAIRAVLE
ncbi:MAG: TetR/AcrR family transcriptional regulator [Acidimicrobiales bacterium]